MAAFGYSGQVVAAATNKNSSHADTHSHHAPKSDARAPIIIQVEPSAKEVEAEAERQAAERKTFWLETDQWIALFTLVLGVSTIFLWRETRRLAEGDRERYFAAHGPRIIMWPVTLYWSDDKKECGIRISLVNVGESPAFVEDIRTSPRVHIPGHFVFPKFTPRPSLPFRVNAGDGHGVILIGDSLLTEHVLRSILNKFEQRTAGPQFIILLLIIYRDETGRKRRSANMFKLDYADLLFKRTNDLDLEPQE